MLNRILSLYLPTSETLGLFFEDIESIRLRPLDLVLRKLPQSVVFLFRISNNHFRISKEEIMELYLNPEIDTRTYYPKNL